MAEPMILELLGSLKTQVATNTTNIATNTRNIATNKGLFDTHSADDNRHWTNEDRENFDRTIHFKGYFVSIDKLKEAYPTGQLGDYAIVGGSDTVWLWDDESNSWLNSTEQGVVISVNGKTGEIVLSKTDVGLSNVDNTSDMDKPVSTAVATILDAKANRRTASTAEIEGTTLRAGIYSYYGAIPNGDSSEVTHLWTVIVGEQDSTTKPSVTQLWINAYVGGESEFYVRHALSSGWSKFKKIATDIDVSGLQTQITENKTNITNNVTDITNLQTNKADRRIITPEEADGFNLEAGIYRINNTAYTIKDVTSNYWTVIAGDLGASGISATQIWITSQNNLGIRMFIRKQDGYPTQRWLDFVEIISTNDITKEQIELTKHYKGYFDTYDTLVAEMGNGVDGDYAIVGSEKVIYIWNKDQNTWTSIVNAASVGSGVVTSVNGLVGDVTLTKTNVGLGNVNNTSDADKPVSTAQQTALNNKVSRAGDTMSGELKGSVAPENGGQIRLYNGTSADTYGLIIRNDGAKTYFLLTEAGDQLGTWNELRPLSIINGTGTVTSDTGLSIGGRGVYVRATDATSIQTLGGVFANGKIESRSNIVASTDLETGSGKVNLMDKAYVQYNETEESIEFIFN